MYSGVFGTISLSGIPVAEAGECSVMDSGIAVPFSSGIAAILGSSGGGSSVGDGAEVPALGAPPGGKGSITFGEAVHEKNTKAAIGHKNFTKFNFFTKHPQHNQKIYPN